jgi:periplasmic protein TonB
VTAEFTVTADGRTANIRVLEATNPQMVRAAKTAVSQWRFQPAAKSGEPFALKMRAAVSFAAD